jgi:tetratricopeptide (TPR) repeat protein
MVALLLLLALPLFAADKWYENYDKGVAAVNGRNYKLGAELLQKAIAEMPNEATGLRAKSSLITYVPHFWLGIAKFNLGDVDGALREWRTSEEQGVLARTDYYARMKDWVAQAQSAKQRTAQTAASGSKKAADAAISRALEMQLEALSAGGDRAESYLAAQRKLSEARGQFQKAGTDVSAYKTAEQTAVQARSLFSAALEEGKKIRAARAAIPPPVKKVVAPRVVSSGAAPASGAVVPPPVVPPPAPKPAAEAAAAPQTPVITEVEAAKLIAKQEERRKQLEVKPKPAPEAPAPAPVTAPDLRPAYRAYARGDFASAERLLTKIISAQPAPEAFLLRGCARYTKAMLSRTPDALLNTASADFRAALQRDRGLRLDREAFSPKLVAFFEDVRKRL